MRRLNSYIEVDMQRIEKITVDAAAFTDTASTHAALRAAIGEKGYAGSNLDALHDVLTSIGRRTRITVTNYRAAEENLGEYAEKLALVLAVSASSNPVLTVVFE
ncbi:MAG: barstar family protein [Clostridia bacterium]|nr:barstar family protein [Clostridia bacterium]